MLMDARMHTRRISATAQPAAVRGPRGIGGVRVDPPGNAIWRSRDAESQTTVTLFPHVNVYGCVEKYDEGSSDVERPVRARQCVMSTPLHAPPRRPKRRGDSTQ